MARRSSARLRERSTTPKRVSLSHDAPARTPKTLPAKLSSLQETDELMPGAFPQSVSPSLMEIDRNERDNAAARESVGVTRTPTRSIKPAAQEMHPQLHHQSTAKPLDEARHLGFSNLPGHHTEPPRQRSKLATLQDTPTRNFEADLKSPSYEFTFRREHSLELSPEAKRLMFEKREEAAAIKKQMIADGESGLSIDQVMARKKAVPSGRYSSVHMKEFSKMDSIANHPSAFRADPNRFKPATTSTATLTSKSLKRSPSKAELDAADRTPSRPSSRDAAKPTPTFKGSNLPRTASKNDLRAAEHSSPAKRVKRAAHEDVSATRPALSEEEKPLPATPHTQKKQPSYPDLTHLTTPTQSSLSRVASVKSAKTSKIPGPQFTPAKAAPATVHKQPARPQEHSTPLLHRSPSKPSFFTKPNVEKSDVEKPNGEKPKSMMDPQLARTPAKAGMSKKAVGFEEHAGSPREMPAPLLARSPVKASVFKTSETATTQEKTVPTPFLARSPSKIPMTGNPFSTTTSATAETPGKSMSTKLLGRFNLLRQSPIKSILRSPQRLYSDDPSKVAAGTHMATPPKQTSSKSNKVAPATAPVRKHVDFSSSTKTGRESVKGPTETPEQAVPDFAHKSVKSDRTVSMVPAVDYPALPREDRMLSPSPQKRRQTAGPADFTFRADDHGIVFGQSPNAAPSGKKRAATIRFIPTELPVFAAAPAAAVGSKKRKHEFEDRAAVEAEMNLSDKENSMAVQEEAEEERPSKRMKPSAPSPVKKMETKAVPEKKRTTLGVKPKGTRTMPTKTAAPTTGAEKKSGGTTISQARLNALSQPKKR